MPFPCFFSLNCKSLESETKFSISHYRFLIACAMVQPHAASLVNQDTHAISPKQTPSHTETQSTPYLDHINAAVWHSSTSTSVIHQTLPAVICCNNVTGLLLQRQINEHVSLGMLNGLQHIIISIIMRLPLKWAPWRRHAGESRRNGAWSEGGDGGSQGGG